MTRKLVGFTLICLMGCESPPPSAEDPFAGSTVAPAQGGGEGGPAAGAAADPGAGGANPSGTTITDGVSVKGTVKVEGYKAGAIQMDFLKSGGASPPLTVIRINEPGPFEVILPKDSGKVDIILYLDRTGDGPGQGDFRMSYDKNPIEVGVTPIEGLEIGMIDTGLSTDAPAKAAEDVVAAPPPTPSPAGAAAPSTTTGTTPATTGTAPATTGTTPATTGTTPATTGTAPATTGTTSSTAPGPSSPTQ